MLGWNWPSGWLRKNENCRLDFPSERFTLEYQLWDLQPNFIADWVDSRNLAAGLAWLPGPAYHALVQETPRGPMIPQQVLLSANSLFIIIGVVGMAWLTRRMRTLEAMFIGIIMATIGVMVAG